MSKDIKLSSIISYAVIMDIKSLDSFLEAHGWLNDDKFKEICTCFKFPLTMVVDNYYIDAAYRDSYYLCWSRFHSDWDRHCKRIFLFEGKLNNGIFFDSNSSKKLNKCFLGMIVVRPAYCSDFLHHTLGRALLDPRKMRKTKSSEQEQKWYLTTAKYELHLLGHVLTVRAFPFSSQDGVVMKCAETVVYELCDYASAVSPFHFLVLPSDIHNALKARLPERVLPSNGLTCKDISYLIKMFGFSPMIYGIESFYLQPKDENEMERRHEQGAKNIFHYYVESAIPVVLVTSKDKEAQKHVSLAIGHSSKRKSLGDCRSFEIYELVEPEKSDEPREFLTCIDTSDLYDEYIIHNDNQIPYTVEKWNSFSYEGNHRVYAYIVPFEKHVFLEASAMVSIVDTIIAAAVSMIKTIIGEIRVSYEKNAQSCEDEEGKRRYEELSDAMTLDEYNPATIRYYLANSANFKRQRISKSRNINDKKFYAGVLMPKSVWVAEVSTYKLYSAGYSFAEVIVDTTSPSFSALNSVILIRLSSFGVYRTPKGNYNTIKNKLSRKIYDGEGMSSIFEMYSNFADV